jgi:hypothetical protein
MSWDFTTDRKLSLHRLFGRAPDRASAPALRSLSKSWPARATTSSAETSPTTTRHMFRGWYQRL